MSTPTLERPTASTLKQPVKARQFLTDALDQDWSGSLARGQDSGGAPFVSVRVMDASGTEMRLTWHTRGTGTYRLFSAMRQLRGRSWHDITLKQAQETLRESLASGAVYPPAPADA